MNIHEFQAKEILSEFGVPVPRGVLATSVDEAVAACAELGGAAWVVKAQIHAGGRGKAGGVRVCSSPGEVREAASALLGSTLVTKQTGESGKLVRKLYIEEGLNILRELYLSLLIDRDQECVSFVASPSGGTDIERVAEETPGRIMTLQAEVGAGLSLEQANKMVVFLGLENAARKAFRQLASDLYRLFMEKDASLLELNPLVLTDNGLLALDAKFVADDNALYRQPELVAMRDDDEEDPREIEAAQFGLNYIALNGDIGCMVNGAGLAMATMDIIQLKGAKPANFLDVGGGVTVEAVTEAFKLLFSDAHVKAVLVNIFGGIVRCDIIASGLIEAVKTHPMRVPVVMRLVGTNEEEGRNIVQNAMLDVRWADDLDQAASMAAQAAG